MLVESWSKESLQGLCFDTQSSDQSACMGCGHRLQSSLPTRGKDSRGHGGIMALTTPLQAEHQLDQLAGQLEHWRQTRPQAGAHIPEPLWAQAVALAAVLPPTRVAKQLRSEEHTSELQSLRQLVCRLLLEKKKKEKKIK